MNKENPSQRTDRELGMDRNIPRRDFLNGAAMAIGAALLPGRLSLEGKKIDEPQKSARLQSTHFDRPARKPSRIV